MEQREDEIGSERRVKETGAEVLVRPQCHEKERSPLRRDFRHRKYLVFQENQSEQTEIGQQHIPKE